ncbi:MAG: COQ9 family protein [Alphaproteobacteria bacterium]|nr:COQ9 family protein [Alphaproteobacteria bacterium]
MVVVQKIVQPALNTVTPLRDEARRRLLAAILLEVPFTGWTPVSLRAAAARLGEAPSLVERLFPAAIPEVLEFWSHLTDAAMTQWLAGEECRGMRTQERAEAAILRRLDELALNREAARLAMQQLSFPHLNGGSGLGLKLVTRTVDELWHGLGDCSTDFNWYSKRLLMAGVYLPAIVYWLSPAAPQREEIAALIQRQMERITDLSRLGKALRSRSEGLITRLQPRLRA